MKIENHTTYKLKLNLEEVVQKTFAALPRNHTLGITRVVFVDRIQDRNIPADKRDKLPLPWLRCLNTKAGGDAWWRVVPCTPT